MNAPKARRGQGGSASRRRESTDQGADPPKRRGGRHAHLERECADAPPETDTRPVRPRTYRRRVETSSHSDDLGDAMPGGIALTLESDGDKWW